MYWFYQTKSKVLSEHWSQSAQREIAPKKNYEVSVSFHRNKDK